MKKIEDLSNKALKDYKKLIDSNLFTAKQLEFWIEWMTDYDYLDRVGLSQRKVVEMTGRSESALTKWRKAGIIKAEWFGYEWLYDAKNIIKIVKIKKVQKGKVVWK